MKIGAAYIRVSTDDQLEYSPDSQLKEIRKFAKANQIILPDEFVFTEDEGRSGRSARRRPEFQRMIGAAKLKPKPFDVILLWKFSRFARNREDSVVYKSMLRKQCGIDVVSVSENIGDDKMSILIEAIIEAMDEWYSVNLSEEVVRGMTEKASRGGLVGSPAFGYAARDGQLVPSPEEAEIVRMVFHKFANEDMGCLPLASMLNAMGVRSKKGFPFENRTVKYMLENPVYIGKIRWSTSGKCGRNYQNNPNVVLSDGHHEPIISHELFEKAQMKLAEIEKKYPRYSRESASRLMLQGIVRCSDCGSTLVHSNEGYQCHSYCKGACKVSHYISKGKLHARVLDLLERFFDGEKFELSIAGNAPRQPSGNAVEVQIQRERQKLERVKSAYENGIDSLEEYRENKGKILSAIQFLESGFLLKPPSESEIRRQFLEKHRQTVSTLRDPSISDKEKNELLRSFVKSILYDRQKDKLQIVFYV